MRIALRLWQDGTNEFELLETEFIDDFGKSNRSVRGKTAGAFRNYGTFQWTTAIQGLVVLMIKRKLGESPGLEGGKSSLASSLDYALSKRPMWMAEMFGCMHRGYGILNTLFLISNSNRKRIGPVTISLNPSALEIKDIVVILNGRNTDSSEELRCVAEGIEDSFKKALESHGSKYSGQRLKLAC